MRLASVSPFHGLSLGTFSRQLLTEFPRDRVIASLTKYDIDFNESEETEVLTERLSAFYAKRSLTQTPIEPSDQAEAIFLLLSDRLSKTTGHIIPVDGGLPDGFMR